MEVYKALLEAKKEIGKVVKNAKNPHFKNTYADINAIIETVEPVLMKHGLLLIQPVIDGKVCTVIFHPESDGEVRSEINLPTNVSPQQLGSAITYYRRYTLQSLLSLQADDDDGNTSSIGKKPTIETERVYKAIEKGDEAIKMLIEKFDLTEEQKEIIKNK